MRKFESINTAASAAFRLRGSSYCAAVLDSPSPFKTLFGFSGFDAITLFAVSRSLACLPIPPAARSRTSLRVCRAPPLMTVGSGRSWRNCRSRSTRRMPTDT
ncbi:hypothetical protein BOSE46_10042 [Bosea sp. 46]|nr:hypothetical protein BOSE46_10042 [Bosea sp. 46]VXA94239.1 hypothetical protein BOSE29B_10042 [Bosea sp. 29B]VXA94849.1 hypothetical protein BOSE125_10042 [Bosea sp. 125]